MLLFPHYRSLPYLWGSSGKFNPRKTWLTTPSPLHSTNPLQIIRTLRLYICKGYSPSNRTRIYPRSIFFNLIHFKPCASIHHNLKFLLYDQFFSLHWFIHFYINRQIAPTTCQCVCCSFLLLCLAISAYPIQWKSVWWKELVVWGELIPRSNRFFTSCSTPSTTYQSICYPTPTLVLCEIVISFTFYYFSAAFLPFSQFPFSVFLLFLHVQF